MPRGAPNAERLYHSDLATWHPDDTADAVAVAFTSAVALDNAAGGGSGSSSLAPPVSVDNFEPALRMQTGETVYDYCWFSRMSALDPASCCFAASSRGQPIHLWDACSGTIRCSYRGYNDVDEPTAAYSLAFSPDGSRLLGGYNKSIYVFDVTKPGRDFKRIVTHKRKHPESLAGTGAQTWMNGLHRRRSHFDSLLRLCNLLNFMFG